MPSSSIRLFTAILFAFVLAGPVLAGTGLNSKHPAAPRRTHQVLDTVTKAPATATKKALSTQAATLVAVAAGQLAAAPQVLKLNGIVRNADGQPCPGASVYLAGAPPLGQ